MRKMIELMKTVEFNNNTLKKNQKKLNEIMLNFEDYVDLFEIYRFLSPFWEMSQILQSSN